MDQSVTIHLIRHEKTAANEARQYIGWTDESILRKPKPVACLQPKIVYGSDLRRCFETTKGYFPQAAFIASPLLRELHFGAFEMKTYEQLSSNPMYRAWIDDPLQVTPSNGESFQMFRARVLEAFEQFVNTPGEYTFVVHGGVIRLFLAEYSMEQKQFQQITAEHQQCTTLYWDTFDEWREGARCISLSVVPITANDNM